jgi:hypothetical protein
MVAIASSVIDAAFTEIHVCGRHHVHVNKGGGGTSGRLYQSEVGNYYDDDGVMCAIYVRQPIKTFKHVVK